MTDRSISNGTVRPVAGAGRVVRVNGPLVELEGLDHVAMLDVVEVGPAALAGEVVSIRHGLVTAQVYEYTGGLRVGDLATGRGRPLSARLGPGLLGAIFDGLLRPLSSASTWLAPGSFRAERDDGALALRAARRLARRCVRERFSARSRLCPVSTTA